MTPPPGSRVTSCGHAIRPPATFWIDGLMDLRIGPSNPSIRQSCNPHMHPSVVKEPGPGLHLPKSDRPTRRHPRRWGDPASPSGARLRPWTLRSRACPSRLRAVVLSDQPTPSLPAESIQTDGSTAGGRALPCDFRHPMETERRIRRGRGGQLSSNWQTHVGNHGPVCSPFILRWIDCLKRKSRVSPVSGSERSARLLRLIRPPRWRVSGRGLVGRDSRKAPTE